jgi:hypothetical protein
MADKIIYEENGILVFEEHIKKPEIPKPENE